MGHSKHTHRIDISRTACLDHLSAVLLGEQGVTSALALTLALAVRGVTLSQAALGVPLLVGLLRRRT